MISNKIIWVTGASSGIGWAVVEKLAQQKNQIFVSARSAEKLEKLKQLSPQRIIPIVADVSDADSLRRATLQIAQQADHLDLLILSAGVCEYQDGGVLDLAMFKRVFATNFFGAVASIEQAMPLLNASAQCGHVVAIGSLSSVVPFTRAEAYGASKAALDYFIEAARVDFAHLDFTLIRPGFIDTPLTRKNDFSMPGLMGAEYAAEKIIQAIALRKPVYNFPWLLSAVLTSCSKIPSLWRGLIAPRLVKKDVL